MDFLGGLALVLLTLAGYSIGAVIGARDRSPAPRLLDLAAVAVLCIIGLFSRSVLDIGAWTAIGIWMGAGGTVSFLLSSARRTYARTRTSWIGKSGSFLTRCWEGWKGLAIEMGSYQSRILLAFFYFLVVTPFGILVRLFSDPLKTKSLARLSFWEDRSEIRGEVSAAKRQF